MTKDDVIERCLLGEFEGTIAEPVCVEWLGMTRDQVDRVLECMLVD